MKATTNRVAQLRVHQLLYRLPLASEEITCEVGQKGGIEGFVGDFDITMRWIPLARPARCMVRVGMSTRHGELIPSLPRCDGLSLTSAFIPLEL